MEQSQFEVGLGNEKNRKVRGTKLFAKNKSLTCEIILDR